MFKRNEKFEMMPPGEPIRKKIEKQKKKEDKKKQEDQRKLEKKALKESYSSSTKSLEDQIRQKLAKRKMTRNSDNNRGSSQNNNNNNNQAIESIPVVLEMKIVERLIKLLEENGALEEVGIFRVSGRFQYIQSIYRSIVFDSELNLPEHTSFYIHDISSAMKQYFTNIPDPLCTFALFDRFTAVSFEEDSDTCSFEVLEKRISTIRELLLQLPELNQKVLELLCKLIKKVSENQLVNKMTVSNCGVVFGPVIFRPKEVTAEYIFQIRTHGMLVEHMLFFYDEIFHCKPLTAKPKSDHNHNNNIYNNNNINNNNINNNNNCHYSDLESEEISLERSDDSIDVIDSKKEFDDGHFVDDDEKSPANLSNNNNNNNNNLNNNNLNNNNSSNNSDHVVEEKVRFSVLKQIQQKVIGQAKDEEKCLLKVGDFAPDFNSFDQRGASYSLYKDTVDQGKKALLFFYPKAFTENEVESATFRNAFSLFYYANCDVIGVSSDSREAQAQFALKHAIPFRLISDETTDIRKLYGVPTVVNGLMPSRVTFVISQTGEILKVHKTGISHRPEDHTLECLMALSDVLIDEQHQKTRVFRKRGATQSPVLSRHS